jgi:signal transduction histidine kinase
VKLRDRFLLTLFLIALLLVAPAVYGLFALRELRQVAYTLSTRDAVGALSLGRLQTAFGEVENADVIYLALATPSAPSGDRTDARARVEAGVMRVEAELQRLTRGGYEQVAAPAVAAWSNLRRALAEEQRLVEAGAVDAADRYHEEVVDPAFAAMDRSLDPIGTAINQVGADQVRLAQNIAAGAATTILLALAAALMIALAIGAWLARTVLRPVQELRRAMGVVAEGNFEPELRIERGRADEIGDLARSFRWMTGELAELERLRAQFVAVASHELKTPLSVIKGYVALVLDGIYGEVSQEQTKVLRSVSDQGDRLGRLIQQLLDISRFEAGGGRIDVQTIELRVFLEELSVSFEALALQNDIDFQLEVEPDLPRTLRGDPDRLNEVIGNLLSNAFKFTPRKGAIRLRARNGARSSDSGVIVEVSDTGVGIPPDKLPHIFEKFYQVENEAQPLSVGSGLGLAIAQEIVEAHGGTITADSEEGRGTTFRVLLPVQPPPHDGVAPPRSD